MSASSLPLGGVGAGPFALPGFAEGSDNISPGTLAMVGEKGPELAYFGSGGSVVPNNQLAMGGGDVHHHYSIDARGAQLGVENRIARSIDMAHASAVQTSVQAQHEHAKRVPQRKR